jgi:hypothetical protein
LAFLEKEMNLILLFNDCSAIWKSFSLPLKVY